MAPRGAGQHGAAEQQSAERHGRSATHARRLPAARARPRSVVAKALSWALRELAKRDPRADREYIAKRKDELPAIVLREVKNKLRTGLKNPKKR